MTNYLPIAEFAEKAGVTKQAIYLRFDKDLKMYSKVIQGKKRIHINALELFNSSDNTDKLENNVQVDSKKPNNSSGEKDGQVFKEETERLNKQINKLLEMLEKEQDKNGKLQEEVINLTSECVELTRESMELAKQAQALQGHMQQQALGKTEQNSVIDGEAQLEEVDNVEQDCKAELENIENPKKKGFFSWFK